MSSPHVPVSKASRKRVESPEGARSAVKRKIRDSPADAAEDGADSSYRQQLRAAHVRLMSANLQKQMGRRNYCTQSELPKSVLVARLLELGELKAVKGTSGDCQVLALRMGGSYCGQSELPKSVLISRLLELGELKVVESVFDVSVQNLGGDTFDVQMGSDENKVLSLKHKIKKVEGTSTDCMDLVLLDEAAGGASGKSEDMKVDVDVPDRVALVDGALLSGACCVVLYVKESDMQKRVRHMKEWKLKAEARKREAKLRKQVVEVRKQTIVPGPEQALSGDCVNGYGKKRVHDEGTTYEGQWQNGLEHGKGTEIADDGTMCEGDWREGQLHGTATFYWEDGGMHDGEWREDMKHGKGISYFDDGAMYKGEMADDKQHGNGTYYFADGEKYEGQWVNSKKHGNGTYHYAGGGLYQGEWRENKMQGTGTCTFGEKGYPVAGWEWVKPGDVYCGQWLNDQMRGIGQWTHAKDGMTERIQCSDGEVVNWTDRT